MRKDDNNIIVALLREALHKEMESVHQYFIDHRILEYRGYNKLAKLLKSFSVDEMRHSDALMGRILFLGGDISVQFERPVIAPQSVTEIFAKGMADEEEAIELYNRIASEAEQMRDFETSSLASRILADEERHFDLHRQQRDIISLIGEKAYIAEHIDLAEHINLGVGRGD